MDSVRTQREGPTPVAWIETAAPGQVYRVCWREKGTVERKTVEHTDPYKRQVERASATPPTRHQFPGRRRLAAGTGRR